jgi:hypothetical protein
MREVVRRHVDGVGCLQRIVVTVAGFDAALSNNSIVPLPPGGGCSRSFPPPYRHRLPSHRRCPVSGADLVLADRTWTHQGSPSKAASLEHHRPLPVANAIPAPPGPWLPADTCGAHRSATLASHFPTNLLPRRAPPTAKPPVPTPAAAAAAGSLLATNWTLGPKIRSPVPEMMPLDDPPHGAQALQSGSMIELSKPCRDLHSQSFPKCGGSYANKLGHGGSTLASSRQKIDTGEV